MWTVKFWKDAGERALRTFAQALIAVWAAGAVTGLADVNWGTSASVAGMAALLSVLMSVAAGLVPAEGDASFIPPGDDEKFVGPEGAEPEWLGDET